MDTQQARQIFDQAIANTPDSDQADRIRLVKEFFTNEAFRNAVSDMVFEATYKPE